MSILYIFSISLCLIFITSPTVITAITVVLALSFVRMNGVLNKQYWIVYGMMIVSSVLVFNFNLSFIEIVYLAKPFTLTIMMILCVTLISSLVNSNGLLQLYRIFSNIFKSKNSNDIMMYSSVLTSPFLNMATPVIYGEMFQNSVGIDSSAAAKNVKRGMMAAMLIAPTFAPIALVIGSHPDIRWFDTIIYSLPLVAITMLYFVLTENDSTDKVQVDDTVKIKSGVIWVFIYFVTLMCFMLLFMFNVVNSIILSAISTILLALIYDNRNNTLLISANEKSKNTFYKINGEALIFISSGILLLSISSVTSNEYQVFKFVQNLEDVFVIPFILLVLPLFSLFKLHPIIGFTLFQPIVYVCNDLNELQKYILWVCYWVMSLQISPISVINITTSNAFDISSKLLTSLSDFFNVYILGLLYCLFILFYGEV